MYKPAILPLFALLTFPVTSQKLTTTVEGDADNDLFGRVASIGDVDSDGVSDYIVGAPSTTVLSSSAGYARVYSGATNAVLFTVIGAAAGDAFGGDVAGAGDVNNDTVPDFIVGASQGNSLGDRKGYAQVFSGVDASQIHKVDGTGNNDLLGVSVAGIGDVNKDGFDDFAVGASGATTINGASQSVTSGKVVVYSGKDKAVLATLQSQNSGDLFGASLAAMADTNGDTYPDILVGIPGSDTAGLDAGSAVLISGDTFATLLTVDGDAAGDGLGISLADVGNVGGDAKPDFAVGTEYGNYLRVYSGADASTIRTHTGAGANDGLGQSVAGPGDLDGDAIPDVLVGAHYPPPFGGLIGPGYVIAYSGSTGSVIFTLNGAVNGDYYGASVAGLTDMNKDGVADFAIGATGAVNTGLKTSGIVEVFDGAGDTFDGGAVTSISLASGGTQTLSLDIGAAGAGRAYLILGSVSGSTPALNLSASLCVPIVFDIYTIGLLQSINQIPLLNALGTLDGSGQATAMVKIPAGFPAALSGLTLTHAFITADPVLQVPNFASNAVQVSLTN